MALPRILLVEDDALVGPALLRMLSRRFEVRLARGVSDALHTAESFEPHAVLTDYDLSDPQRRNGVWLIRRLALPGVVLTGFDLENCPCRVFRKPTAPSELVAALQELLRPQD